MCNCTARITLAVCLTIALGPAVDPAVAADPTGRSPDRVVLKFADGARVRLRGTALVSLSGQDLSAVARVLAVHGPTSIERLFERDEVSIDAARAAAESRESVTLPDLNGYYEIAISPGRREGLIDGLRSLPAVETVYRPALAPPPPGDIPPTTPDGEPDQLYLDPAPIGIDAEYAWTRAGGTGAGILIIDIEWSWRTTHEDLGKALGASSCYTAGTGEIEHGTAVLGELVAGRDGYGVSGIVYGASLKLVTDYPTDHSYSVARAVDCAGGLMRPGDVMLVEAQTYGPRDRDGDGTNDFVPVEWDQAEYDAIRIAAAAGIVVVEPAGNGAEDLDDPVFVGKFSRVTRDSGAILVGAACTTYGPGPDLSRQAFSTYGSRVDLQGWGDDVITTGFGDAFDGGGDPNQYYTSVFSGTSAAAPMVAGAAAAVQGVQKACGGGALQPKAVRELLVQTGRPQVNTYNPGHIGPRPDLRTALPLLDTDNDGDGWAECAGDCDDGHAATRPGAVEVNDGLDNQCPGGSGFGVADEITGNSGFHRAGDKTEYSWAAQSGATSYQVARSGNGQFTTCTKWTVIENRLIDSTIPAAGAAFYYLVQSLAPYQGSWGQNSKGSERTSVCP
jgi:hypothetical protein